MTVGRSVTAAISNRSFSAVIVESFLFTIINSTAIVGNLFVIVAISRNPALRKITNWYILSLAISDLIVAITCFPLSLGASIKGQWLYSDVICQVQGHVIQVWACFSLTIVALTAVNRYYRVVRPILYRKIFTKRLTMIITAACLLLSAIVAVGMMYVMRANFQFGPHFFCTPNFTNRQLKKTVSLPIFLAFILISLMVVILCYFKVYRVVRRHVILVCPNLRAEAFHRQNKNSFTCRVDEINATKMVFAIITVYCLLWIPVCIIGALYVCDIALPRWAHLMYDFLLFITAATNPLIYGLMNKAFRDEYVRIMRCLSALYPAGYPQVSPPTSLQYMSEPGAVLGLSVMGTAYYSQGPVQPYASPMTNHVTSTPYQPTQPSQAHAPPQAPMQLPNNVQMFPSQQQVHQPPMSYQQQQQISYQQGIPAAPPEYPSQSLPHDYYAQSLTQPSVGGYSSFPAQPQMSALIVTAVSYISGFY